MPMRDERGKFARGSAYASRTAGQRKPAMAQISEK